MGPGPLAYPSSAPHRATFGSDIGRGASTGLACPDLVRRDRNSMAGSYLVARAGSGGRHRAELGGGCSALVALLRRRGALISARTRRHGRGSAKIEGAARHGNDSRPSPRRRLFSQSSVEIVKVVGYEKIISDHGIAHAHALDCPASCYQQFGRFAHLGKNLHLRYDLRFARYWGVL